MSLVETLVASSPSWCWSVSSVDRVDVKRCFAVREKARDSARLDPHKMVKQFPSLVSKVDKMNGDALDAYVGPSGFDGYLAH